MAKLQIKSEKVAAFGGIFHVMDVFEHLGLGRLIDMSLGKRDASWNAKYSYKKDYGYFPGWASIGGILVGGENRDGNTNVKFHQADTLIRIMDRVKLVLGIIIKNFRADCGSFSKEIIEAVEPRCEHFYIRASNCSARYEEFRVHEGWESVEIDYQKCELASFDCEMNGSRYRLVVQRSPKKEDGRIATDMFGTVYVYRAIITNDWKKSEKDVVLFYNKRGESEKNFDIQNNDFGWAHLPFSFMNENTVFVKTPKVPATLLGIHEILWL